MANRITLEAILDASGVQRGSAQAESYVGKLGNTLKEMLPMFTGAAIGAGLASSFREFAEAERQMDRLGIAVRNAGGDWTSLQREIKRTTGEMQFLVGFSDDDLQAALRRMITATGNVQGSMENLGLVADVAAAFDRDLVSAATMVSAAMEGNYRKLAMLLPELKDLAKEGLTAAEVFKLLRERTVGAAAGSMKGASGAMIELKLAIDELKEGIGSFMNSTGVTQFIRFLASGFKGVGNLAQGDIAGAGFTLGNLADIGPGIVRRMMPQMTDEELFRASTGLGLTSPWITAHALPPFVGPPLLPPEGFVGPPSPFPSQGEWDALAMRDLLVERPMGLWNKRGLRGKARGEPSETVPPEVLPIDTGRQFAQQMAARKEEIAGVLSGAIQSGFRGGLPAAMQVFRDAIERALIDAFSRAAVESFAGSKIGGMFGLSSAKARG